MVLDVGMRDALPGANEASSLKMCSGTWPSSGKEPLDTNRNHVPPLE